ncbi:hypothetical protein UACE39S_03154 [Ureibacillus acetophenoni]
MEHLYKYSPIVHRKKGTWPNGANLAVIITMNLETWDVIKETATYAGGPDILPIIGLPRDHEDLPNYSWREYGPRVGFWRLLNYFNELNVQISSTLNTQFGKRYPEALKAAKEANWEFIAHSTEQHELLVFKAKNREEERSIIEKTVQEFEEVLGYRPKGWLSPSLAGTLNTPSILAELGFSFMSDLQNDEQPYVMNVGNGKKLVNVPYSAEINDFPIFIRRGNTPNEFYEYVKQEFDVLLEESKEIPRIFNLGLHPHVTGRPARARAVANLIEYFKSKEGVWFATREEVAKWALENEE